jgi:hypothetical protein
MNAKIDWTKPIEYRSVSGTYIRPAAVVGRDGENYVVRVDGMNTPVPQYYAYKPDGYNTAGLYRLIYNVPPPKIEKTVVLLLWNDRSFGWRSEDYVFNEFDRKNVIAKKTITITEGEGLE